MRTSTMLRRLAGVSLLGLVAGIAAAPAPLLAGDRSVTMFGDDAPPPDAAPPRPGAPPLSDLKTENAAGLDVQILPNGNLRIGTRIAFRVSTHKKGYLVLVDINSEGRLTQIYPNVMSLSHSSGNVAEANALQADSPVTIPNPKNPLARFIFTADLPRGAGAIVAILSDRPVQVIDLPDAPAVAGTQAAIDLLTQTVFNLKIASSDRGGEFTQGVWSFAAAPYLIE